MYQQIAFAITSAGHFFHCLESEYTEDLRHGVFVTAVPICDGA